jgi:hypothetical protein
MDTDTRPERTVVTESPTAVATMPRAVRLVHLLTLAAVAVFLLVEIRKQWFYLDEWDFLAYRGVHLVGSEGLFAPHNEHWTTIPILIWRALFNLVGVRDYWLYALPLIAAHLVVVHLLWRLMVRHEVDPWTATLLVAAFAVLGVGSENLTRAFQITFVGSVAFGLLAIDALERDRFWPPPIWGVCALMCSNIGIPMVFGCVLVGLVRRRYAAATMAAIPPALVFIVWYALIGHTGTNTSTDLASLSLGGLVSYVWTGLTASLGGLVDGPPHLGAVFVAILAGAAVTRRNVPAALALTAVVLYAFVGLGRLQYGVDQALASRYSYIAVALCLPLIGQLVTQLTRRRDLRPIVMSGLIVLIGANAVMLENGGDLVALVANTWRGQIEAAAYLIHTGQRFPGFATSTSSIGPPNEPSVAALTSMVRRGQFPVPRTVPLATLDAERAILGVFVSKKPGYPAALHFADSTSPACIVSSPQNPVTVELPVSGSIRMTVEHPGPDVGVAISFPLTPQAPSVTVSLPVSGHWLNVPAGAYPSASVTPSTDVRLCEVVPGTRG